MKILINRNSIVTITVLGVVFAFGFAGLIMAATAVNLGTADDFAILAGTAITETGTTVITGDVGLSPDAGSNITGLTAAEVLGTIYAVDATGPAGSVNNPALVNAAKSALVAAYNAAGQVPVSTVDTELGGTTKTAGIYNSAAGDFGITGTLTLNAEGNPNAVFIFKTASTLITAGSSNIVLQNGAQACNVFWQVGSSATLGTDSFFKGNILALTSATLNTGANVEGRVLARNGAVTLDGNIVTKATCAVPPSPPAPPVPAPSSSFTPVPPLISVKKVPSPLVLPSGPGSVTYTYTVENVGYIYLIDVTLVDDKCNPSFVSGDTNGDSQLDMEEKWIYGCSATLTETTKNTAIATGHHPNGGTATDVAIATVVVGLPTPPPLINIIKKPTSLNLLYGGGEMTYTYTVTNPGTVPLSDVSVIDDKCTGLPGRVVGHPGDLNNNNLLESNETWTFTCKTNITQTTTNTATAEGHANGLTAIDFALATVVVAAPISGQVLGVTTPNLPNTGFPPEGDGFPWNIVISIGILAAISLLYIARKKLTA